MNTISVIIPTYNRAESLFRGLSSLQEQTLSDFEILVVDNAADSGLEAAVSNFNKTARIRALYIAEPNLGLHNARHAGARVAHGQILVYTDDDAVFDKDWLKEIQKPFSDSTVGCVGGKVVPKFEVPPADWIKAYCLSGWLSLLDLGEEIIELDYPGLYGVNFSVRKDLLYEAKGFNPEAFGDIWLGDGETGLLRKVLKANRKIIYNPNAVVTHVIPAQRLTQQYMDLRFYNQGACASYHDYRENRFSRWRLVCRSLKEAVVASTEAALSIILKPLTKSRWHFFHSWASYWRSRSRYDYRLATSVDFRDTVLKEDWLSEEQNLKYAEESL